MRKALVFVALAIALGACSDPRKTELPSDLAKMDTVKPQFEKLSPEDKELLAAYLLRREMKSTIFGRGGGVTDAKTIGDAIDNQRQFKADAVKREAEQAALKAKAKADYEAAAKALTDAVTVALVSKKIDVERGYSGIEMDRRLSITVAYQNNTDKAVAGVKGTLVVRDVFGDVLSRFGISNDRTIEPKGRTTWSGGRSLRFNMGNNKDDKFADLAEDKYKVIWEPETVVFSDGTKLTAERPDR